MTTITLSLVSHTNAGKTTLARTLLAFAFITSRAARKVSRSGSPGPAPTRCTVPIEDADEAMLPR